MKRIKEETRGRKPIWNTPSVQTKRYRIPLSKENDFDEYAKKKIKEYLKTDKLK